MDTFVSPLAELLALFYELVHSYAIAISLLTITVMVVLLPLTVKGTRSMLAMQKLAPEIKKLQDKHKNDRTKLNEEVMALYKDNKISPLGGCLPLLLQLPVFLLLYTVIAGLTRTIDGRPEPKYLYHSSQLYTDLVNAGGRMESFGVDLSLAATATHDGVVEAMPYFLLIAFMVIVQYWQQWQISSRAPAADTPQARQMKIIQRVFPPFFGVISLSFPAGVVLYWVVSSLFRVAQQWAMYRFDPVLKTTVASAKKEAEGFLKEKPSKAEKAKDQEAPVVAKKPRDNASKKKKKRKGK